VGPLTLFAPVDDAFAALPDGTLDALLADPTGPLTDILLYHVLGGDIRSTDLSDGQQATTLNGQDITVTINNGVFINDAQVIQADIGVDNGVVHAINGILLPTTTSTKEINNFAFAKVFPNPAQDNFTLSIDQMESDHTQVRIIDMEGRILGTYANVSPDQVYDTVDFQNGLYLIEISANGNRFFKKLIIKK